MAIKIHELYLATKDLCNPEERGLLDVDRFNRFLMLAGDHIYDSLTGFRREYSQEGQPQSGGYPKTLKIADSLKPFITEKIGAINTDGIFPYPDNYFYRIALRVAYDDISLYEKSQKCIADLCNSELPDDPTFDLAWEIENKLKEILQSAKNLRSIEVVDSNKIGNRLDSDIENVRPNKRYPIAEQLGSGYRIIPASVGSVVMIYLREPTEGKLVMIFDEDTETETFDAVNSKDPDWPKSMFGALAKKTADLFMEFVRERPGRELLHNVLPSQP